MIRITGPDCVVMCNLINTHTHTQVGRNCASLPSPTQFLHSAHGTIIRYRVNRVLCGSFSVFFFFLRCSRSIAKYLLCPGRVGRSKEEKQRVTRALVEGSRTMTMETYCIRQLELLVHASCWSRAPYNAAAFLVAYCSPKLDRSREVGVSGVGR